MTLKDGLVISYWFNAIARAHVKLEEIRRDLEVNPEALEEKPEQKGGEE